MRIWTIILYTIIIIYQNHVCYTAPVGNSGSGKTGEVKTKFGKIADQIINPKWTLIDPDSKKKKNDSDPSDNTVKENDENQTQPNTPDNDNERRPKKNNKRRRKKSNNKKKSNKTKQNNIRRNGRRNGRHRWYKMVTVDYLLGNLPEYRNHENEQIWGDGDERKIELNEHVDALSKKNLNNIQLIRKKRDYNNTFQIQNKLQAKNVKQEELKKNEKDTLSIEANANDHSQEEERQIKKLENEQNIKKKKIYKNLEKSRGPNSYDKELSLIDNLEDDENSMKSNSIENSNENMNSNKNKFHHFVKTKKHPTNTFRNKLRRPNYAQKLDKTSGTNYSKTEKSPLKTVKQKPNSLKNIPKISKYQPEFTTKGNADTTKDIAELKEIDSILNEMNSNTDENLDSQNNDFYSSSLDTQLEIPNYSDIEDNKERDILNTIRHPVKSKSKKKGKQQPNENRKHQNKKKQKLGKPLAPKNINEKGSHQKTIKPNLANTKDILIISYDEPENMTKVNPNTAENIPEPDEIDTIIESMNSNSDEKLDDQTNGSYPSSLETKQEIPNYSDLEDIKEHDILNDIKHPLKPKSKNMGKKLSNDNDKLPKKIKQELTPSLESDNNNGKGNPQKTIKTLAPNLNEIPIKSNDVPKLITEGNYDRVTNGPEQEEIDNIMEAMDSNYDEKLDDQTNESYPSSLETKQEIPNYSDIEDIKERDILNNIKHPLKPKSKNMGKKLSNDNDKLPKKIKQELTPSLESNNNKGTGSPQKSIEPLAPNLNEILNKSNDLPKLTTEGNHDIVTNGPEQEEIDNIMEAMDSNSDEKLDDHNNLSYLSSLETKQEIPNYSDLEDIKEHDILNDIKHPLKPKSKRFGKKRSNDNDKLPKKIKQELTPSLESVNNNGKGNPQKTIKTLAPNLNEIPIKSNDVPKLITEGNYDRVTNGPEQEEIDNIMEAMDSNSDEKIDDQTNESYPSSLETKQEIPNYSDIEDIKERDILNNIKHPLKPKSKNMGKKLSNDNDKLPKKIKQELTPSLESNNNKGTGSPQKSIEPLAHNLNEILNKSNDLPKLTTEGNHDIVTNGPEQEEIDNIMEAMDSNSDEKLDDQTNGSYPSSLETKQEIPNYSDIEDIKERDILNNIKHPLKPKSKNMGKKLSNDNDKLPKKIKQELTPSLESNNNKGTGSPQKSIEPLAPNLNEILNKSNDLPKITTEGNHDRVTNGPEQEEIDNIMEAMDSNSDEKLDDQTNESYPSSLETKQEIPNYSDIEDIKERDILNNIKHPLKPKSKNMGKKLSNDNDKLPKKIKQELTPSLESNNNKGTGSPQKSIEPLAPNLNEILNKSNDLPKLTTEGNHDIVTNGPEQEEIDNIMEAMDSNSDEKLDDHNNLSYLSSLETKQEIPNYSDTEDIKERDILNNIKHPLKPKSKNMGKKLSNDNDKLPKKIKQELTPSLESDNNNGKGNPQKTIKTLAPNLNEIPIKSNDVPKLITEGNYDRVTNGPEQEEIDNIMEAMDSNSDEKLDDHNNLSYLSSLETKQEIPNYSDLEDIKEHDILNDIKHPLKPKSKRFGKKRSNDNDKLPKKIKQELTPSLESDNNNGKGNPQKTIKTLAPNLNEIPIKSNDVPKLITEGNYDRVTNGPEQEEIDNIMEAMDSNYDEKLDDQTNESYPSSLETKQEIPNYSDIEDIKERDILNNIKHPLKPKSKNMGKKLSNDNDKLPKKIKQELTPSLESNNNKGTGSPQKSIEPLAPNLNEILNKSNDLPKITTEGNHDRVTNGPEQEEIDNIIEAMDSNSDEKLDYQTNGSNPSSLETKQEIPNYSDIEDIKERDILNNIKHPLKPKSKMLGKIQSDDKNKLPKKLKQKLTPSLESNNNNRKGSPQKTIKPLAPNLNEIPIKSNDVPKLITEGNYDRVTNGPEQEEIDNIMEAMDSNSDEKLDDQTNESYPSSLETKQEIPNYSDIEDIKERDILNNIKHPLKPKSKNMGKKLSNDNDKLPKKIKQELTPSLESNNNKGTGSPQKSIEPLAPNLNEILNKSNDLPKLTTEGNHDIVTNVPEQEEIDNIMEAMDSNSDEKLDDHNNLSYLSSLETKQEIPNYSDLEDIKEHDILNDIKHPLKPKSKRFGKKRSNDNDKLPKKIKQELTPSLESDNNNGKGNPQKSIEPLAPNLNEILNKSNDLPKITTEGNHDRVTNGPEQEEIDNIMEAMDSNSDEKLDYQTNGSNPSSLETKQEIPNYSDIEDIKERDILNNIKHPLKPKSKMLGKIQSDDKNKLPKKLKQKLTPSLESNNNNRKGSPQKTIKPLAPNLNEIPIKSNDVPKLITEGNYDRVTNGPEQEEIDNIIYAMDSNSDEKLDDHNNLSYLSSLETKQEIPNYSDIEDIKERDSLTNIKHPLKPKSKNMGKMRSNDNDKLPKKIIQELTPSLESNNNKGTGSPQKSIEPLAPNLNEILNKSNDLPKLTTEGNHDIVTNDTKQEEIDNIIYAMDSNSDEKLDDQTNGSYPSLLETKQEIPNYSDIEDIKERDILNNIKHPLKPKSKNMGKKLSNDNDKLPKKIKQELTPSLESNNNKGTGSSQKSIEPLALNLNEILNKSNDLPKITTEGNHDRVTNGPEQEEIDNIMEAMDSNSDEKLDYQTNGSNPSSLETKQEIPNYSDIEDIKERDILNNIKHPLKPKSKMLGKIQSDDKNKLPKKLKQKLTPSLESNNNNEKGSLQKSIKPLATSLNEIPRKSNYLPKLTTGGNDDKVTNTPEQKEIDNIMDAMNSISDEKLDDHNNLSYLSSLETKQHIPNYSDFEDDKKHNILKKLEHPFKATSKTPSNNNEKVPNKQKINIGTQLKPNNIIANDSLQNYNITPHVKLYDETDKMNPEITDSKTLHFLDETPIIVEPNVTVESISNKLDKPNIYSKIQSIDIPDKDFELLDNSDDYNNLGGMTMEDSDLKKPDDKSPTIKDKQEKIITEKNKSIPNINYKTIKPDIADSIGILNFSDEKSDEQMKFINDFSEKKSNEEKPSESNVLEPMTDKPSNSKKELLTDDTFDKNSKMDGDDILHNIPQPNSFESETGKPISDDNAVDGKINVIPIPSISKDDKVFSNNSPGNQNIIDPSDISISSSFEELLKIPIDEDGLQLPSINFDDITITPMGQNYKKLPNSKDDNMEFSIPNDQNSPNILEKNKSMEKLNINSNTIFEKPNVTGESISNKLDKTNIYSKTPSIDIPDKDFELLDNSDEYSNLGGMTMEDSDLKKPDDKSPTIKDKQEKIITEKNKSIPNINYKTIKPDIADSIGILNFSDEKSDEQMKFINDFSEKKSNEEKPSESNVLVPMTDILPNSENGLSTDDTFDKNSKMDGDDILHNVPQPNSFESETGKPISDDDAVNSKINVIPFPSISKDPESISNKSPGNQKIIDLVDKSVSSSIEELLKIPIDEDSLQLPSINFDDITITPIEKIAKSLPNSKDDTMEFSIPNDHNSPNILDKNKSMEKLSPDSNTIVVEPNVTEGSISNKHDKPNIYSKTPSIDIPNKDVEFLDISDEYNNLGGMTMEDSDLKKPDDKSPTIKDKQEKIITEKNESIPNINNKTIKPDIADSIGILNFSDEKSDEQIKFINDISYEKSNEEKPSESNVFEPMTDKLPNSEKELLTDDTFDKNSKMDGDDILHNVPRPNSFESESGKPISDDNDVYGKINVTSIPSISNDDKGIFNNSPGNQKIIDLVDKSVSSSIEELLKIPIDEDGLQLPSINFDDITITPMGQNYKKLPNSKDDNMEFSIPNDQNNPNILEKNKSMEKLNINSNTIFEKPNVTGESISNKLDKPNIYSKTPSIDIPDKDFELLDNSDEYSNLGGMTMEDTDLKKTEDKSSTIKDKQEKIITEKNKSIPNINYKTIKPDIADSIGILNFSDEKSDEQMKFINDFSEKKSNEEKPSESNVLVPMTDILPNSENGLSTDDTFDKNSKMDGDDILHNVPQPNSFESETGKPISDDDAVNSKINVIPFPSISKDPESISNKSPGNQKIIDLVDKSVSSSIEELLKIPIDEDSLQLPSINFDDITITPIEKIAKSLPNSKDDTMEFSIPNDHNSPNILDKNKSMEKLSPDSNTIVVEPNVTEGSISNKHDKPNIYSKTPSIDIPNKDVEFLDISDEYNNLGGMTMEDSDLKKPDDKSPTIKDKQEKIITEKNESIPNINNKTIKPDIADSIGILNFSDEKSDEQIKFINDISYEKSNEEKPSESNVFEPMTDKLPNSEKELLTDDTFDKNSKMDGDDILHNVPRPNSFESESGKPISDDNDVYGKINVTSIPSISNDDKGIFNNSPGNQKIIDLVDKSVSSSIEELLKIPIDEDGLQLPSINFDDITITPMGQNYKKLPNSKDDNMEFSIPNDQNNPNILEKNKSMEKLNINSNTIFEKPNVTVESISNELDKPNIYSKTPSIDIPDKDFELLDNSDEYSNLGGMTMEDTDLKKTEDKSSTIKDKQEKIITEKNKSIPNINYKTIKPDIADSIGILNFSDEKSDEQMKFINDFSEKKSNEEKPSESNVLVPMTDILPNSENGLSTDDTFDKNSKMDGDDILHNVPQPNSFESETGKPISDDDAVNSKINVIPFPSISKDPESISNKSPGNQKIIDLVDKSVSSSIEELLKIPIDEDSLQLPSINFDDITITPIEKIAKSLPNSKDDTMEFSIPNDHNSPNILDKNKSMEKLSPDSNTIVVEPNVTEGSISNKHDKPNIYSKTPSIDIPNKDVEFLDISDEYNNLGGMTMEDSDLKKPDDKSPTIKDKQEKIITEKNESIPNINNKTIKPDIADCIGKLNFSDEKSDEQMKFINDFLDEKSNEEKPSDKSNVLVPMTKKLQNYKKELSTDDTFDKNSKMDGDDILHNVPRPNSFESESGKPISDDNDVYGKINVTSIPSISNDDKGIFNNSPGNQKIIDLVDKSVSSSIEELLKIPIDEDGLQLPSINIDDITITSMDKNDESLPNSKDENIEFSIPNDHNSQNILDKNKSMEKLNLNSNTIIEEPNVTEESISNKHDSQNIYSETPSIDIPDKDIEILDISEDYKNLGGMTMEDSDLKKNEDKSPIIKVNQDKSNTEKNKLNLKINYKTTKPEIAASIGTLNFSDVKPDDQLAFINDHSYVKANEEKPSDKSIDLVPTMDILPNSEKGLSTDDTFDNYSKMDNDIIFHKVPQPNSFESETGKPISKDEAINGKSNVIPIPSITKDDEISDINKAEVKLPNRIIIQKKTGNNIVPSTNVHEKIFPGNSENDVNLSIFGQNSFKSNSVNSKVSNPDKHILITNKDEYSSVLNSIDKHNNSLLDDDEDINFNPSFETKPIMDNSKYMLVNRIKQQNNEFLGTVPNMEHTKNKTPYMLNYNLLNEEDNPYGYMLPKFSTKYIEGGDSNNLWEIVPPKKNHDFCIHKVSDNYNNDINQSMDYNIISSHVNNDKNIISETETVKNSYDDKGNTDIHKKFYDDFIKKMSEQLLIKIDNIDDKISKLDKLSNNSTYITQSYNLRSDDPETKKILLTNDLPIIKPKNNIEEPDSELDSKINKSVESHETMISYKSNDENVIKESTKPKKEKRKKHKRHNKKHKKHSKHRRHKKKKSHKKNDKNDSYNDDEDDNNDDFDSRHKKYKIHKKNDKNHDDDKHKKNKSRKKNEMIDSNVDDEDDDDDDDNDDGRAKKKSHKKNYINDDDVEVSQNKKTDNKKKKKVKENISPNESNKVNNSSSLQINSEDDDSVKGLKIKSKSKNSKKTNSTKRKKSSPKKKSKHMKHSKSIKYKYKEIPVDISDEDSSRNNNQNNVQKPKTHKHKKHKKPLKTSKTYKYKEIPVDNEDKISDENNVNLEETYNINITNDDNALNQKRLRHKRLKKMKNIDINIVKDTDNQVLNRDTNTKHGYQFYTFYPQYRYTNPFARLFY